MAGFKNLDVNALLNNPRAKITITFPDGDVVFGFQTQDISFGGGNVWDSPENAAIVNKLNSMAGTAGRLFNSLGQVTGSNSGFSQMKIVNPSQTMATWSSSNPFTINIALLFVATGAGLPWGEDVTRVTRKFCSAVYPAGVADAAGLVGMVNAPLGYAPGNTNYIEGALSLNIGTWLTIPPILLVENQEFNYSSVSVANGSPLYANGTVQFRSAKMLTASDVLGFFST